MKRFLALVLAAALTLALAACHKTQEEPDDPTVQTTEAATEYEGPSVDEMSPPRIAPAQPRALPAAYGETDRSGFVEIDAADAMTDNFDTAHIYRDGDAEYYELKDGKVFVIFPLEDGYASVYYDETGKMIYYGLDPYGWFYADGETDYLTYAFTLSNGNVILSFYEPDGSRFAVFANNEYYDGSLDLLSEEDQVELVRRVTYALAVLG